jgi:hypothetical protein
MRNLFISEQRYIRNVLHRHSVAEGDWNLPVVSEYYAPPRVATAGPLRHGNRSDHSACW